MKTICDADFVRYIFFFKQKTAYEMRISDWSSDVCSSDLRPDLMAAIPGQIAPTFQGEKITVFMSFILSEIPPGLRGFVTVGVIAAAAINSGLISMAAVAINDFYRPFIERKRDRKSTRLNSSH